MPTYMDFHSDLQLPQEVLEELRQQTRDRVEDEYGVRQVELFHNAEGAVFCLLDGPDEDAIRKHHAALEVPCGEVHRVESLL